MKQNFKRKLLAGVLSVCMIFQTAGMVPVYAVENGADSGIPIGASAMCENHTEHTSACGYEEGTEGAPCTHEHTEDCYVEVEKCVHEHTDECYPETDDEEATKSDAKQPTECTHMCDEESGCITMQLDCQHKHDEECGYVEAVEGSPCTHTCELCAKDGEEATEPATDSDVQEKECLCDPVVSSEGVHTNEECPYYVKSETPQDCTCETPCTEDKINADCPVCGVENADLTKCTGKENAVIKLQPAVEQLIAKIDALPNADEITDENREAAKADFEAVFAEYEKLFEDESITDLDEQLGSERMQKLTALREALLDIRVWAITEPCTVTVGTSGANYSTFTAAIQAIGAVDNCTIQMNSDMEEAFIIGDLSLSIDLNGYSLTATAEQVKANNDAIIVKNSAGAKKVLTICDTSNAKTGKIVGSSESCIDNYAGIVEITGGTINHINNLNSGTVNLRGGMLTTNNGRETFNNRDKASSFNMTGGNIVVDAAPLGDSTMGIYGEGSVKISGGEITAKNGAWGVMPSGGMNFELSGGSIIAEGKDSYGIASYGPELINLNGGTIIAKDSGYGIVGYSNLTVNMTDGTMIAGKDSCGIYNTNGKVLMSGGIMVADPEGAAIYSDLEFTRGAILGDCSPSDNGWKLLGNYTLPVDTIITANSTLSIPEGSSLTINSGTTLTNNGTLTNAGTLTNNGTLKLSSTEKFDCTSGILSGEGTFEVVGDPIEDMIVVPTNLIYNGSDQTVAAKAAISMDTSKTGTVTIGGKEFSLTVPSGSETGWVLSLTPAIVQAGGKYTATYTKDSKTISKDFTVAKSGTNFEGGIKTYNNETAATTFTYGDTITVKVTPKATGTASQAMTFPAPTANQMALFIGETQISEPQNATSGAALTFTIDTSGKALVAGSNTITAKYLGNNNMADYSDEVTVTLNKKAITSATVTTADKTATKVYDGTTNFTGVALTPNASDILSGDTVTATANGTVQDANVGTEKAFTATSTTLDGTHKDYYSLAVSAVTGNVAITTKSLTDAMISGIDANYDYTGKAIEPTPTVADGTPSIIATSDYTVSYGANKEVSTGGTVTITATSGGNYSGTASKDFTIGKSNSTAGLTVDKSDKTYTYGDTITFTVNVGLPKAKLFAKSADINTVDFYLGTDTTGTKLNSSAITLDETGGTGTATFAYNTTKNAEIPFSDNITVTAVYGGSGNLNGQTASVSGIKLQKKPINGTVTINVANGIGSDETKIDKRDTLIAIVTAIQPTKAQSGLTYQWYRGTDKITGATKEAYEVAEADKAKTLSVKVTAAGNYSGTVTSTGIEVDKEPIEGSISITGSTAVGDTLTLDKTNLTSTGATFTTKWQRNGVDITGATSETYQLTKADLGKTITVVITGTGTFTGSMTATKDIPPVKPEKPVITATAGNKEAALTWTAPFDGGSAITGYELTVTPSITGSPFTIAGSTTSYTVTGLTNGTEYEFTLKATNAKGDSEVSDVVSATPNVEYTVTFQTNGGSTVAEQQVTAGNKVTKPANPTKSNNRFDGWYKDGAFTTAWDFDTDTVQADTTIYAKWTYNGSSGGGSSSGGSGSGGSSSSSAGSSSSGSNNTSTDTSTTGKAEVKVDVDQNGNATVSVTDQAVADAIKQAQDAAKKNGTDQNGISVVINVTTNKDASTISATLPKSVQEQLTTAGVKEFKIVSKNVEISLNQNAIKQVKATANADVSITATKADGSKLSAEAQTALGGRPVYDFKATYVTTVNGIQQANTISQFGSGSVSISIPYTLGANEKAGNLCAIYIDDNGKVTYITNSSYDVKTGKMLIGTNHFSYYGIGYKADTRETNFADIAGHWAKDDIEFVAARGLLAGTAANTFSPNLSMTRGMFVTALGRLAGADVSGYTSSSFTDVTADAYYMGYVEWANSKAIVKGTSATTFAPDQAVTREEMAVMMENYAKAMGYTMPKANVQITFSDSGDISTWAKDSVKSMQMVGIIMGKDNNRFDPKGTATRAEVSAVLHRFVEVVIDTAETQGWMKNDSGHWLYYKDGVMLAGKWIEIDKKWYYLQADGTMATNTTIDGYEVDENGARKENRVQE